MSARETSRNSILNLLDLTFLEDRTLAAPSVYGTAVSTVCNLHCPHCLRESLGIQENAFMSLEKLAEHKEDLKAARKISLFGLGEPFLHPKFFEFVAMFKELGLEVATSSHGMSLKPGIREKVIESGLDDVTVSMDGADKKMFEETRVGAIFETVVENVTLLTALKKERRSALPMLNINMTILKKNVHQIPMMVRLAHQMGAQSISFSSAVIYKESDLDQNIAEGPLLEKHLERGRAMSRKLGIPLSFWRQKPIWWEPDYYNPNAAYGCSQLWSNEIIEPDGSVKLCCYIEEDVANAFETGPKAAFNCDELRKQRRMMMEGRVRPECQGCLYLRERTPLWIQAMLNDATKMTRLDPNLTDEDRRELMALIDELQARKNVMFPLHAYLHVDEVDSSQRVGHAVWDATIEPSLPVY